MQTCWEYFRIQLGSTNYQVDKIDNIISNALNSFRWASDISCILHQTRSPSWRTHVNSNYKLQMHALNALKIHVHRVVRGSWCRPYREKALYNSCSTWCVGGDGCDQFYAHNFALNRSVGLCSMCRNGVWTSSVQRKGLMQQHLSVGTYMFPTSQSPLPPQQQQHNKDAIIGLIHWSVVYSTRGSGIICTVAIEYGDRTR